MAVRQMSKLQKRRLAILGTISVVAIGLAIFTSVSFYISITKLERSHKELNEIIEKLKEEERDLSTLIKKLNDPEYIAKYARENYLYSKEGEYVIKLDEDNNLTVEETVQSKQETFDIALLITVGSVVLILLLIKILFTRKKKDE